MTKKMAVEKRADGARWTSKEVGPSDFSTEDLGKPESSKKVAGKPPEDETDRIFNLLEQ